MSINIKGLLHDLDPNPGKAAVEICDRLQSYLEANEDKDEDAAEAAFQLIVKFASRARLPYSDAVSSLAARQSTSYYQDFRTASGIAKRHRNEIEMDEALSGYFDDKIYDFGYAILSSDEKKEIERLLSNISSIIQESDLNSRKKNKIFEKIADLQKEVYKDGTKTDGFVTLLHDLWFAANQMVGNRDELMGLARDIYEIVSQSRAKNENVELPPPADDPLLPKPE
ncbi:MAG: hypothetical protein AAF224_06850 [Pseudomonadota bacterium]